MAQVLVPGVAQAVISGENGLQPWACVTHWKYDGTPADWTPTNIQLLAQEIQAGWITNIIPQMNITAKFEKVDTVDIGSATPATGTFSNQTAGTDTGGTPLAASVCLVVSKRIPARYRGGHPRIYLPVGNSGQTADNSNWNQTFVTNVQQAWTNLVNHVRTALPPSGGNLVSEVAVKYTYTYVNDPIRHKYVKQRGEPVTVYVVQSYLGRSAFGTQRRRMIID